jgi:hypothetical protein
MHSRRSGFDRRKEKNDGPSRATGQQLMTYAKTPPSIAPAEREEETSAFPEAEAAEAGSVADTHMNATAKAAKTSTERNRARRASLEEKGIKEIRGVYAPLGLHAEAKEEFRAWLAKRLAG